MNESAETHKPLKVLSASAGSGKTFSLVQTYLSLTLGEEYSPLNVSKILAMTFTNKAAWEMKQRIIDALDALAFGYRREGDALKKSEQLMKTTQENLGMDPNRIQEKAQKTLAYILHNYEAFQVMTIDKFSLRLIRTFAKDLDINDDFEVVLNEDELIEQVVDELLSKLGNEGHEAITKLAIAYAKSNLVEGDKWDFRKQLIDFAKVLKSEKEQPYIEKIVKQQFDKELHETLLVEGKKLNAVHQEKKEELLTFFKGLNLTENDFPRKGQGLYGYLTKYLPGSNLKERAKVNSYTQKTLTGELIKPEHNVPTELIQQVTTFIKEEEALFDHFFVVDTLRRNLHNLALLKYIAQALAGVKERDNIVRISEFNRMISSLLAEENAPYIYERLGTKFRHYLLDEFQDTSRLQWMNLLPLVHDAIAQNAKNLIVGDPKQAIYRFRNGLVEQFVALPKIYNLANEPYLNSLSAYFDSQGNKESLDDNWRSQENIVRFNNAFFAEAITHLPATFSDYYADVRQHPKGKKGGYVAFDMVEKAKDEEDEFILSVIEECEADGFNRGDICLLARNKRDGKRWARMLSQSPKNYKVVSADSLTVGSDKAVQACVDYFYLRRNAKNKTLQIKFVVNFLSLIGKDPIEILADYWGDYVGDLKFEDFIADYFEGIEGFYFEYENLYDIGRQLITLLGKDELKNPYLHHFMEQLHRYDLRFGPDIRGFVEYWETKGSEETVQLPANNEAIQIMTVHKAKGLEFPVVILPNLNWSFSEVKSPHFVEVNQDTLIHTRLVKDKAPTFITERYDEEFNQQLLDEFNLFYVAVTRPVNRLYGLVEKSKSASKKSSITSIAQLCEKVVPAIGGSEVFQVDDNKLRIGERTNKEAEKGSEEHYFLPKNVVDCLWFPDLSLQDEEALQVEHLSEEQRYGNQLHEVLSKSKNSDNLKEVIQQLQQANQLDHQFIERIEEEAGKVLNHQDYLTLFERAEEILSEQDLICDETKVKRPDLVLLSKDHIVVVDYKTGEERKSHYKQVQTYMSIFEEMGYEQVEGKLVYTSPVKVRDVS